MITLNIVVGWIAKILTVVMVIFVVGKITLALIKAFFSKGKEK